MFIKLFVLLTLFIFKIHGDGETDTTYTNCDFDLLNTVELDEKQKLTILAQFPEECLNLSNEDKLLSEKESVKFAEFINELRKFDDNADVPRIDEYDKFYETIGLLECNNKTLPYEEYVDCVLLKRGEMIELIKQAYTPQ